MRTVTVNKEELLKSVRANRQHHRTVFLQAQEEFRKRAIEELEKRLADARDGKHFDQHLGMIEPVDRTDDYDRIISMLEMSVDDKIDLTQDEYAAYVMDDWSWKRQWLTANSTYVDIED